MPDPHESDLIREATAIFLRLRDDPDNPALRVERDSFLARGEAERTAYAKMLRAWEATGPERLGKKPGSGTLSMALIALGLAAGGALAFEPLRVALLADIVTRHDTATRQLASGDRITLDASSAVINETGPNVGEDARMVTLMRGAAFFEVESGGRPFTVTAGEVRVEVVGTNFEVGRFEDGGIVTVTEGAVDVALDDRSYRLSAGERLIWSDDAGPQVTDVAVEDGASWRTGVLVADGLTLAQIADVLDRRLPGEVVVVGRALAGTSVVGTFDLADPSSAVALLAELTGARVTSIPYVMTIVSP